MVDSKENDKFDPGVKGLMHCIVSVISILSIQNTQLYSLQHRTNLN